MHNFSRKLNNYERSWTKFVLRLILSACWLVLCRFSKIVKADSDLFLTGLQEICGNYTGIVGCKLWELCESGDAIGQSCQSAALLASACRDLSTVEVCKRVDNQCNEVSGATECQGYSPLSGVAGTMDFYAANQGACNDMYMTGCDSCSPSPSSSNLEAVLSACPDPLGTLAGMCLQMAMTQCQVWSSACDALGAQQFPSLCVQGGGTPRPLAPSAPPSTSALPPSPAMQMSMPVPAVGPAAASAPSHLLAPAASDSPTAGVALGAATLESCVADPQQAACKDFSMADADANADMDKLCDAMPNMVGCSLRSSCQSAGHNGGHCSPFSLLGSTCVDMPSMSACANWSRLCAPASVVQQCVQEGPLVGLVGTAAATSAVLHMCASHSMAGCEECSNQFTGCPHPLNTLSKLCWGMSGMSDCTPFYAMCSGAAVQEFPDICGSGGGSSGESIPPMTMWFHQRVAEVILFKEWIPRTTGAYVASWIACTAMAVVVQGLKALRSWCELQWLQGRVLGCGCVCNVPLQEQSLFMTPGQLHRNVWRSVLTGLIMILDYWNMLVVMTFNIGLFVAVVTGYMLGALLFGHFVEFGQAKSKPSLNQAESASDSEGPPVPMHLNGRHEDGCCG